MKIKVLGSGCKNCKKLLENVKESIKELNVQAEIEYVTDIMRIAKYNLMRTPGLIFDEKIVSSGKVPSVKEVNELIKTHLNT